MDLVNYKAYFDALQADTNINNLYKANEARREIPFTIYSAPQEPGIYTKGQEKLIVRDIFDNKQPDVKTTNKAIQNLLTLTDLETASKIVNDLNVSNPNNIEFLNTHFKGISKDLKKNYSQMTKEAFLVLIKNMVEKKMTEGYVQEKLTQEMKDAKISQEKERLAELRRVKREEEAIKREEGDFLGILNPEEIELEKPIAGEELVQMRERDDRRRESERIGRRHQRKDQRKERKIIDKKLKEELEILKNKVELQEQQKEDRKREKKARKQEEQEQAVAQPPEEEEVPVEPRPKPKKITLIKLGDVGSPRARKLLERAQKKAEKPEKQGEGMKPLKLVKLTFN